MFVDVPNDFGQGRRAQRQCGRSGQQGGGHLPVAHRATELAAHAEPQALHGTRRISGRVGIGQGPDFFSALCRVATGKTDARRVTERGLECAPVVAAGAAEQRHCVLGLHAPQRRVNLHMGHAALRVWGKGHQHRFVIDQQRVRAGVVGAQRLAVKSAGVGRVWRKGAAVEHDVALDSLDAKTLQPVQQQPQAL